MIYVWIVLVAVFSAVEAVTLQLVGIWFAGGAFCAAIAGMLGADKLWQSVVFFAVSIILLITTRPLAKRLVKSTTERTNADSMIGREIELSESVDNIKETGRASVNGVSWSVRSSSGGRIDEGTRCVIERIEGVKLIVTEKE